MAKEKKRAYGTGEIVELDDGRRAIRWRETYKDEKGEKRTRKRYETLGEVSERHAAKALKDKLDLAEKVLDTRPAAVTFRDLAEKWREHILPNYKALVNKFVF